MEEKEFPQKMQQIEALVRRIEALPDSEARASALSLLQLTMELHGAGLERMMEITFAAGAPGGALIEAFARDQLTGSLLLLYGLHPLDLETRVMEAVDKLRAPLRSHGGAIDVLGIADGVVRLRLERSAGGCGSTAQALKLRVEEALYNAAPDLLGLEIHEVEQRFSTALVQLTKSAPQISESSSYKGG